MTEIVDEANETYEDPNSRPDKDEVMSSMQQEEVSKKPIHRRMAVSKQKAKLSFQTSTIGDIKREREDRIFKNDSLRKKYDLRNVDPKTINNTFLRMHIEQLKKRTEEGKLETGMKETFG